MPLNIAANMLGAGLGVVLKKFLAIVPLFCTVFGLLAFDLMALGLLGCAQLPSQTGHSKQGAEQYCPIVLWLRVKLAKFKRFMVFYLVWVKLLALRHTAAHIKPFLHVYLHHTVQLTSYLHPSNLSLNPTQVESKLWSSISRNTTFAVLCPTYIGLYLEYLDKFQVHRTHPDYCVINTNKFHLRLFITTSIL